MTGANLAGKCVCTLHSYNFSTGRVKINEQVKSIATGLFYIHVHVCTDFEAIGTLLQKDI